ncbi:MAG TPA: twin-arginine translocase TatA/TatE family subunit [Acidimicrobiales bacterium]|nr:twin-arginine translocase TatA/TatE family subunit [Acidimicrobiales bacterium]
MGSIGPAEIVVVLLVALIVLGPTRLPDAARSVGKALAELRRVTAGVQAEVRDAFAEPPTYPRPPTVPDAGADPGAGTPGPSGAGESPSLPRSPEQAEVAVSREPDPPPPA